MPKLPVTVLAKQNNSIPITISNTNLFGNSLNLTVSGGHNKSERICMHDSVITLSLLATPGPNTFTPFEIIKPVAAWISNYNLTYTNKDNESYVSTSMTARGQVAAIMMLIANSYSQSVDTARLYYSIAPIVQTTTKFQVTLSLRYIFDLFMAEKYLDLSNLMINLNFLPLQQVFNFPSPSSGWNVTCTSAQLNYDVYKIDLMTSDSYYLRPNSTRVYTQQFGIQAGTQTSSITLSPPGALSCLMYYFGDDTNTFNAAGNSLPIYAQLQNMSGKAWPTNPSYELSNPADVANYDPTYGYARHYRDFLSVARKISTNTDTFVTADRFLANMRIYSIECQDDDFYSGTYTLQITQNVIPVTNMVLTVFGVYNSREADHANLSLEGSGMHHKKHHKKHHS